MKVELVAKSESSLREFVDNRFEQYLAERLANGENRDVALRIVTDQRARFFPADRLGENQFVYSIVQSNLGHVGDLWVGRPDGAPADHWWIYYVGIHEGYRRQGLGTLALIEAEKLLLKMGATQVGLNVFGNNPGAKVLYKSLGYVEVSAQMSKDLHL